mmetsp:Transcript_43526/g.170337  ORF Transcript_43526/g.170337 Transcript_43526/m.170337 type:complete len:234 (-) Transcript_43526:50-751(-)
MDLNEVAFHCMLFLLRQRYLRLQKIDLLLRGDHIGIQLSSLLQTPVLLCNKPTHASPCILQLIGKLDLIRPKLTDLLFKLREVILQLFCRSPLIKSCFQFLFQHSNPLLIIFILLLDLVELKRRQVLICLPLFGKPQLISKLLRIPGLLHVKLPSKSLKDFHFPDKSSKNYQNQFDHPFSPPNSLKGQRLSLYSISGGIINSGCGHARNISSRHPSNILSDPFNRSLTPTLPF